jgi:predicted DNA-binding transcriptional regulator AlpA
VVESLPVGKGWSGWVDEAVKEWLEKHLGPSC